MASRSLLIFNSPSFYISKLTATTSTTATTRASFNFKLPHVPEIRISGSRRQPRGMDVVSRAGPPSTSTYVYAFVLPLSLLAITVFTSLLVADKLDRDYLEELAINEAIKEAQEGGEEEEEGDVEIEEEGGGEEEAAAAAAEEAELPRPRNRPRREVEA